MDFEGGFDGGAIEEDDAKDRVDGADDEHADRIGAEDDADHARGLLDLGAFRGIDLDDDGAFWGGGRDRGSTRDLFEFTRRGLEFVPGVGDGFNEFLVDFAFRWLRRVIWLLARHPRIAFGLPAGGVLHGFAAGLVDNILDGMLEGGILFGVGRGLNHGAARGLGLGDFGLGTGVDGGGGLDGAIEHVGEDGSDDQQAGKGEEGETEDLGPADADAEFPGPFAESEEPRTGDEEEDVQNPGGDDIGTEVNDVTGIVESDAVHGVKTLETFLGILDLRLE